MHAMYRLKYIVAVGFFGRASVSSQEVIKRFVLRRGLCGSRMCGSDLYPVPVTMAHIVAGLSCRGGKRERSTSVVSHFPLVAFEAPTLEQVREACISTQCVRMGCLATCVDPIALARSQECWPFVVGRQ